MVILFAIYLFIMYINAKVVSEIKKLVNFNYETIEKSLEKTTSSTRLNESVPLLKKGKRSL